MRIYPRIRNLREDKDMTQTQIADILHCSQRIYSNYEQGEVDIPTTILIQLAKFHQVSTDYLLNLTDNPKPYPRNTDKTESDVRWNHSLFCLYFYELNFLYVKIKCPTRARCLLLIFEEVQLFLGR